MRRYTFTLDLEVTDTARLHEAAKARLIEDERGLFNDPIDHVRIEKQLGTPEDPNIPACIEVMFDPGESSVTPLA
jgi:hypothetical protein